MEGSIVTEQKRNPKESRSRILQAATTLFAAKGFDGTGVNEIADAAGLNKRMIYHYFGSKEGLYVEVLRDSYRRLLDMEREVGETGLPPLNKVKAYIRRYFYFLAQNEEFVKLLQWESLQAHRFSHLVLPEITQTALPRLSAILENGVREGVFRRDLDVRHLLISINAMCLHYFSRQHVYQFFWRRDMADPDMLEERLQHILDFTLRGMLAPKTRPEEGTE